MANKKPTGDCAACPFKKGMMNKAKGKKLPDGGKCTYPGGFCSLKENGASAKAPENPSLDTPEANNEVDLSLIYPNPHQPRKIFHKEALEELAQSIKEQGLIEPLVVVPRLPKLMLVAGERRWRACQMAGLAKVPVRIICANDDQVAEMALVENIQRQDLTPLEEAKAFQEMLDRGYTKEGLAQKLGFKQVWRVDERLNLLRLAPKYQEAMIHGIISPSQAFEISRLESHDDQEMVFQKLKAGELPTYNHIRRFVTAMVDAKTQSAMFSRPRKEDMEVMSRCEKALDDIAALVTKSFFGSDCRVLSRAANGNAGANIEKIDLIIKHLTMIKKAMLESASRQEVQQICLLGGMS